MATIPQGDNGIVATQLVRTFGEVRAVDGIDLEIAPGEIYGFLGRNGAGKSTTVLMLTTLLPPTSGTATVAGRDIVREGAGVRATIGAALQAVALDRFLTAREHALFVGQLNGLSRREARSRGDELLDRVGLSDAADRKVGGYSGGMQRRLDLALALLHQPSVLFLDEPTTGLDPQSRTALWEEVERLARDEGVTVFLTTQYLEEADVLADRIGIIDRGKVVTEGTSRELKDAHGSTTLEVVPADRSTVPDAAGILERFGTVRSQPDHLTVDLRAGAARSTLTQVVRSLDAAGIQVDSLAHHEPSLDDVFLATTGRVLEGSTEDARQ